MKNRLMLLALAVVCYGHIQAEGWLTDQLNRIKSNIRNNYYLQPYFLEQKPLKEIIASHQPYLAQKMASARNYIENLKGYNYTPYQQGSFKTYPPENVASRLASMKYLYGSDVAKEQKQLIEDYEEYLNKQYFRQIRKDIDYSQARRALLNSAPKQEYATETAYDLRAADYLDKQLNKVYKKSNYISNWEKNLVPTIRQQEAEMLRPWSFEQHQHPNQYILNN